MTSVEKRKPFPQVCCEFLIPVQKTVPTKIFEHFPTSKGGNDMGPKIVCLFRNIWPEQLVQSMVKVGYFFNTWQILPSKMKVIWLR